MEGPILVQGAMQVEANAFVKRLENVEKLNIDGYTFYKGMYNEKQIIFSVTKVGSLNSCISTLIGIKEFSPVCVINQGVAGGETKDIHKKDLVIGTECKNTSSHESMRREEGEGADPTTWQMVTFFSDDNPEEKNLGLKSDEKLVEIAKEVSKEYNYGNVHLGILGSSDTWDNEVDFINYLHESMGIISADMESIGAYTVCKKYNVPVIGIRVISDNSILSEGYEREVADYAQEFVLKIIEKLG
jgi:adenosylhomocysteine nucleosidase